MTVEQLNQAARDGDESKVLELIAGGADVNAGENDGWSPLHWAGWNGHAAVAEALLSNGADANVKENLFGETPLHYAGTKGHLAVVEVLLSNGADVNLEANDGKTPLDASRGHADVVEALVEAGADPDSLGDLPSVRRERKTMPTLSRAWSGRKDHKKNRWTTNSLSRGLTSQGSKSGTSARRGLVTGGWPSPTDDEDLEKKSGGLTETDTESEWGGSDIPPGVDGK